MFQEECPDGGVAPGPVLHGIGQHLHGHLVATQIVAHKDHLLHILHTTQAILESQEYTPVVQEFIQLKILSCASQLVLILLPSENVMSF